MVILVFVMPPPGGLSPWVMLPVAISIMMLVLLLFPLRTFLPYGTYHGMQCAAETMNVVSRCFLAQGINDNFTPCLSRAAFALWGPPFRIVNVIKVVTKNIHM